jgi:hypothetical protein
MDTALLHQDYSKHEHTTMKICVNSSAWKTLHRIQFYCWISTYEWWIFVWLSYLIGGTHRSSRLCGFHMVEVHLGRVVFIWLETIADIIVLPCIVPVYKFSLVICQKMTSFLLVQMAQHSAAAPIKIYFICFSPKFSNPFINM